MKKRSLETFQEHAMQIAYSTDTISVRRRLLQELGEEMEAAGHFTGVISGYMEMLSREQAAGEFVAALDAAKDVNSLDSRVASAVRAAASSIVVAPSFKEELVHRALEPALALQFGDDRVIGLSGSPKTVLPDWDPQPGAIDVSVVDEQGQLELAFELKVDDVRFTFWDMLKMASAARLRHVRRAYLVVAASTWTSTRSRQAGRRFFASEGSGSRAVSLHELMLEYEKAFAHDLAAVSGRLTKFARAIEIKPIAVAPVTAWPGYELRAIGVRDAPGCTYVERDDAGWPSGFPLTQG